VLQQLEDLVGDIEEQLEVKLSGLILGLGQVDITDIPMLSFNWIVIEGGSIGLLSKTYNSRCTTTIFNNIFLCYKTNQLPLETMGDKGGEGHRIDNGHHKCSNHHDHTNFGINDGNNQTTCIGWSTSGRSNGELH